MPDSILTTPPGPSGSGTNKLLVGAVIALIGAVAYQFYEVNQLKTQMELQLTETKELLMGQVAKVSETHSVSNATAKRSVDLLRAQVDEARRQANLLAGEAKVEAEKHADDLAAKLQVAQDQQAKVVAAVASEVSTVKEEANITKGKVGEVASDVATVKTEAAQTKSELEKTIADLKSTRGDLGVQSGLIATNSKELGALRALGERNYVEFKIAKEKTARKVGDLMIRLKSADPKRNRYTIEVTADDKMVEKKDKSLNEPVQFMLSRATQPFEIVVNDVKKDLISGYLASPKVQQSRN